MGPRTAQAAAVAEVDKDEGEAGATQVKDVRPGRKVIARAHPRTREGCSKRRLWRKRGSAARKWAMWLKLAGLSVVM